MEPPGSIWRPVEKSQNRAQTVPRPHPKKKPPEGGFFRRRQEITSSRALQALQGQPGLREQQVPKHQRQVPEPERRQEPVREPEPERVLSCHKRPERLQQR